MTWKYNLGVEKEVHNLILSLGLPSEYIGFHIRGGDKFLEHKIEPIENYFSRNETCIKNVFVLTDDYTVFLILRRCIRIIQCIPYVRFLNMDIFMVIL